MSHPPFPEHHPADHCLVEWYRPGAAELLLTIVLPGNEVAFCLFAATSPALAEQACRHAGCRTTRTNGGVTTAVRAGRRRTTADRRTIRTAAVRRSAPTVHTTPTAWRPS